MRVAIKNKKNESTEKIERVEELIQELNKIFFEDLKGEIVLEIAEPSDEGFTKKD